MTAFGAGKAIGAQGSAATELVPKTPGFDPADTVTYLPGPTEETPSAAAAGSPCWSLCEVEPVAFLAMLTLYMMLCYALMKGAFKLNALLSAAVLQLTGGAEGRRRR